MWRVCAAISGESICGLSKTIKLSINAWNDGKMTAIGLTSMSSNNFEAIARLEFSTDGEGHNCGIINCVKVATA